MGSIAKKGLNNYVKQLKQHPLRTKVITAGVLSGISDIVSQKLTGIQKIQLRRLLLKVIFGAAYLGPFGHYFHMALEKIFPGKKDTKTIGKKFWPVVGWINHQFMPLHFRVVFQSLIAFCWGIFLNLRARTQVLTKA